MSSHNFTTLFFQFMNCPDGVVVLLLLSLFVLSDWLMSRRVKPTSSLSEFWPVSVEIKEIRVCLLFIWDTAHHLWVTGSEMAHVIVMTESSYHLVTAQCRVWTESCDLLPGKRCYHHTQTPQFVLLLATNSAKDASSSWDELPKTKYWKLINGHWMKEICIPDTNALKICHFF